MNNEDPKGRAYWEWLRTANPWLPPYERLSNARFSVNVSTRDMEMKVVVDWPAEPFRFDGWEEAIEDTGIPRERRGWERHLSRALRALASAMEGDEDVDYYRNCLAVVAANVRALAPGDTKWEEEWPTPKDGDRRYLRASARTLLVADEAHGRADGDLIPLLQRVESYLHGLWLAAKEEER